ncbi:MAG: type II toxin-antitoxin system ChpB family toxin [Proteobacteria bacterium]|nr:type II toxin-antitoxin system ChpB family toxin [Pseudomonadota bacterium]MCL2307658.1 type II toxin-antitoxin system ChpB family toxin [Pseudomonadota bacterium]
MPHFDRGDIVNVPLDPVMGHEQRGVRPALVLTTKEFNKLGDTLIAPITQGGDFARYAGFAVALSGTGCKTQGVALMNKIRMLDLNARKVRKVERAPSVVVEDALVKLTALLELA